MSDFSSIFTFCSRVSTRYYLAAKRVMKTSTMARLVAVLWILPLLYSQYAVAMDTIVVIGTRYTPFCTGAACGQALDDLAKALAPKNPFQTKPGEHRDPVETP